MNIKIESDGKVTNVKIEGRIDTTTASDFQNAVNGLMEIQEPEIAIDCSDLEYTSSQGLRSFLMLQKAVTTNRGTMVLNNMKPEVREIFDITGFSSIIKIA